MYIPHQLLNEISSLGWASVIRVELNADWLRDDRNMYEINGLIKFDMLLIHIQFTQVLHWRHTQIHMYNFIQCYDDGWCDYAALSFQFSLTSHSICLHCTIYTYINICSVDRKTYIYILDHKIYMSFKRRSVPKIIQNENVPKKFEDIPIKYSRGLEFILKFSIMFNSDPSFFPFQLFPLTIK